MLNLLSNAVKFSTKGSIKVNPEVISDGDKHTLSISVADQGIGMSNEEA